MSTTSVDSATQPTTFPTASYPTRKGAWDCSGRSKRVAPGSTASHLSAAQSRLKGPLRSAVEGSASVAGETSDRQKATRRATKFRMGMGAVGGAPGATAALRLDDHAPAHLQVQRVTEPRA